MSSSHESNTPVVLILIIGIVIVGALIGIFFPKGIKNTKKIIPTIDQMGKIKGDTVRPIDNRETDAYYTKADIDTNVCGVKVFSPLPGQKVSFPLEVSGYVNGCGWVPFEGQVGTLEVRDNKNALSPLIILPVDGDNYTLPAYFKVKINPQNNPISSEGVLIFHNDDPSGENPQTFQVPVVF